MLFFALISAITLLTALAWRLGVSGMADCQA
jgi:hypothetical protein